MNELDITDRLSTIFREFILQYLGHITRGGEDKLEKIIVQGTVEGGRPENEHH